MSFPGPNQPPSNGGGNKPNGGNNPFTNPFSRNNDGKNGGSGANGNKSNGPRPFWQSPWLWVVVVALLAVTMFQLFAGAGSQTIDTKDGMQILNGNTVEYATIVDNTQQVKLKLSSDYSATDPDTGRTKNYGKNVQFYYTYAQSAAVVKAVQKADPAKGWTASMQQTSIWTYLLTSLLPFLIIFGLFWFLMSRMGGAAAHVRHGRQEEQRQTARRPDPDHQVLRRGRRRRCRAGGRGNQGLPQGPVPLQGFGRPHSARRAAVRPSRHR